MKNYLFLHSALLLLPACSGQVSIEGSWVEPVPGMPDMQQGFTLEANGKASSIEMATLQYESWKKEGNQLILSGKSIGNHLTIDFSDTLTIEKLTADSLILKRGEVVCTYTRAQEIQTKESIPAATLTPAKQIRTVKGELVIAHEVRAFTATGDSLTYWVIDKTGELARQYDELTGGVKNGTPVYAELEVIDMGKSDEGFAAEYDGVYQVEKIQKLAVK